MITTFYNIFHGVITTCMCFFSEIPRIEELQDPSNSPRREEVGRRTLGAYGGFLLPFFYRGFFHPDTLGVEESSSPKTSPTRTSNGPRASGGPSGRTT